MMLDFGISEFLAMFLVGFPVSLTFILVIQRGVIGSFFIEEEEPEVVEHHHYHYKDRS